MKKFERKKKIKKESTNLRFNILTIIVYVIGVILISKLFQLQILNGEEYRETSNTRLSRTTTIEASRGEILDRSRKYSCNYNKFIQFRALQDKI